MPGYYTSATSGADGLTLRNSSIGIALESNWNGVAPSFHDLVIQGMQNQGITALTYGTGVHVVHPTCFNVTITACGTGIDLEASAAIGSSYGTTLARD